MENAENQPQAEAVSGEASPSNETLETVKKALPDVKYDPDGRPILPEGIAEDSPEGVVLGAVSRAAWTEQAMKVQQARADQAETQLKELRSAIPPNYSYEEKARLNEAIAQEDFQAFRAIMDELEATHAPTGLGGAPQDPDREVMDFLRTQGVYTPPEVLQELTKGEYDSLRQRQPHPTVIEKVRFKTAQKLAAFYLPGQQGQPAPTIGNPVQQAAAHDLNNLGNAPSPTAMGSDPWANMPRVSTKDLEL